MNDCKKIVIASPERMEKLGGDLSKVLSKQSRKEIIIFLSGDLGAGKTTFVRGFLRGLDYLGNVKSPTYTLVEPYELAEQQIYHFDLYRLHDPQELALMGIRDYFHDAFCLIEWPEKALALLPSPDLQVQIQIKDHSREVFLQAFSDRGKDAIQTLEG